MMGEDSVRNLIWSGIGNDDWLFISPFSNGMIRSFFFVSVASFGVNTVYSSILYWVDSVFFWDTKKIVVCQSCENSIK